MLLRISPAHLRGTVSVPESKSLQHRQLITQWLAGEPIHVSPGCADDIRLTANGLTGLSRGDGVIDCGMSGSTLRFLLPVAMASGRTGIVFTGAPRLLERPIPATLPMERVENGIRITAPLRPGRFDVSGEETSQLISGLLTALPLLKEPSEIRLTTPMVSAPYVDMTIRVMAHHGVTVERTESGFAISAPQQYHAAPLKPEGDWSAASCYIAYNALAGRGNITVENLCRLSVQGDSCIESLARSLPQEIDISPIPDLLPALALLASLQAGRTTRFVRAGFLRGKESDRLSATATILHALGAQAVEEKDGLTICGVAKLQGGVAVDAQNDHRMAMLAAFAGALASAPIVLNGAESVGKSYPRFWEDYAALGGKTEVVTP